MGSSFLEVGKTIRDLGYVPGPDDMIQMDLESPAAPKYVCRHKYDHILLVVGAGLLFEAHVVMFGSYATDRLYRSASHWMKEGKQEKLSADSSEEIILREKKHFWFRTFSALNHMTNVNSLNYPLSRIAAGSPILVGIC